MSFQRQLKDAYVCLGCSLKLNKRSFSTGLKSENSTPASQPSSDPSTLVDQYIQSRLTSTPPSLLAAKGGDCDQNGSPTSTRAKNARAEQSSAEQSPEVQKRRKIHVGPRLLGTQLESIALFSKVAKRLTKASDPTTSIKNATQKIRHERLPASQKQYMDILSSVYNERTIEDVCTDIATLQKLDRRKQMDASAEHLVAELTRKGLLKAPAGSLWHRGSLLDRPAPKAQPEDQKSPSSAPATSTEPKSHQPPARELRRLRNENKVRRVDVKEAATSTFDSTIEAKSLSISHLPRIGPGVPRLSHDLSRVLFNPGIYQLQDPRSRVYNFNPYLENIMPVSEFDFKALKDYITSSRDDTLRSLALQHGKKYVGSSSSMTSILGHFHFLLSQWRDINTEALSKGFSDTVKSFTIIQRSPSSVFLRYHDGVYAMDADKQYDSGNILMSLGKSMEKLLTQAPEEYERYRKSSEVKVPEEQQKAPEAYQYTHTGDFLMRAQLDAHDPRLPGTGTFDLKTRAVASIRHHISNHEEGFGYQIKTRFGDWESYEREYFDMMRSAFLKYSLQVRLGQMDGIFVAFHNVERIFGFQYISLPEMDLALHGQYDTTLGDQEFKVSVELLNQVLNRVTERFPRRSLRLQFETRDLPASGTFMQIFAEPMEESDIEAIQTSKKKAIDAFEQGLMNPGMFSEPENTENVEERIVQHTGASIIDQTSSEIPPKERDAAQGSKAPEKSISKMELMSLKLRIENRVNGNPRERPDHLSSRDNWSIAYNIEEEMRETYAQSQYRASKARQRTALEDREENTAVNYYLRRLRDMAASGAQWRKAQDELDAGRQKVVLYGGGGSSSGKV